MTVPQHFLKLTTHKTSTCEFISKSTLHVDILYRGLTRNLQSFVSCLPRELATGALILNQWFVKSVGEQAIFNQITWTLLIERVNAQLLVVTGQATCKALYLHPTTGKYETHRYWWEARLVTTLGRIQEVIQMALLPKFKMILQLPSMQKPVLGRSPRMNSGTIEVAHYTLNGRVANTRPHQLRQGDREKGTYQSQSHTQNQPQRRSQSVSRIILEAIYVPDEVWGRDQEAMKGQFLIPTPNTIVGL